MMRVADRLPDQRFVDGDLFEHESDGVKAYKTDPTKPINSWKERWESVKDATNVRCRFHDLRPTAVTRMLEGGVALPVVASILGWSAATTVRMAKRYGHIGQVAQRQAVSLLEHHPIPKPETETDEKSETPIPTEAPSRRDRRP
jgi:integrase